MSKGLVHRSLSVAKAEVDEDIVHAISNGGITYDVGPSHPGGGENVIFSPWRKRQGNKRAQNGEGL